MESLARLGGSVTSSTFISSEITGKRLELLKEMLPHAKSVALVANPDNPATALQLTQARKWFAAESAQVSPEAA